MRMEVWASLLRVLGKSGEFSSASWISGITGCWSRQDGGVLKTSDARGESVMVEAR